MAKSPLLLMAGLALVVASLSQADPPATSSPSDNQPRKITFVSVIGAGRGEEASVTVQVAPGAKLSIVCVTPSGKLSEAKGLADTTADADGKATWKWLIGKGAKPGIGTVVVTTDGDQESAPIEFKP